ncbi:MAG: hypothetical protein QM664_12250 [Flavihumibacter sp.]
MGSNVVSAEAGVLAVHTGHTAEFGKIAGNLQVAGADTDFDKGHVSSHIVLNPEFTFRCSVDV